MKKTSSIAVVMLFVAGGFLLASCASTGVKRSASAASILDGKTARLKQFDALLSAMTGSLDALQQSAPTDPRAAYGTFLSTTKKLNSEAQALRKEGANLREQAQTRFDVWQKEIATIQDQDLRAQAEKRREAEIKKSKEIEASMAKVSEAYLPLEVKLKDLTTFLDNDLNASGIQGASKLMATVKMDTQVLQKEIQETVTVMDRVSAELAPRPPVEKPAPAAAEKEKAEAPKTEAK